MSFELHQPLPWCVGPSIGVDSFIVAAEVARLAELGGRFIPAACRFQRSPPGTAGLS